MKIKKKIPWFLSILILFAVLALVGGCNNWQRGIEEVSDSSGPSWDVDLAIPLVPEIEIQFGEELFKYLVDQGLIDSDYNGDLLRLTDELSILDDFQAAVILDNSDFDLESRQLYQYEKTFETELNLTDEKSFDLTGIEANFQLPEIKEVIPLDFELEDFEDISVVESIPYDRLYQVVQLDNGANNGITETLELQLAELPDQVRDLTFNQGDIIIEINDPGILDYSYIIRTNGEESTDGAGYFKDRTITGGEKIEIELFIFSVEGAEFDQDGDFEIMARVENLEIGLINLNPEPDFTGQLVETIDDIDLDELGDEGYIYFSAGSFAIDYDILSADNFEYLDIAVADKILPETSPGIHSFQGLEIYRHDLIAGSLEISIGYQLVSIDYQQLTDKDEIIIRMTPYDEIEWYLKNYSQKLEFDLELGEEYQEYDVDAIRFSEGQLSFEFQGEGLEDYQIEIRIDDLRTVITDCDESLRPCQAVIELAGKRLAAQPEIEITIISGRLCQEPEIFTITAELDARVSSILLGKPYILADELEEIKIKVSEMEGVEELVLAGKIQLEGLEIFESDAGLNQLDLFLILPDGSKLRADEEHVFDLGAASFRPDSSGNWRDIILEPYFEIGEINLLIDEMHEIQAIAIEDIDWAEVVINRQGLKRIIADGELEDMEEIIDLAELDLPEIADRIGIPGNSINLFVNLDTDIEDFGLIIGEIRVEAYNDRQVESGYKPLVITDKAVRPGANEVFNAEERQQLIDMIIAGHEALRFTLEEIELADKKLRLKPENQASATASLELMLSFEIKPDAGLDYFSYRTDLNKLSLSNSDRQAIRESLVELELVQELINELPLVGEAVMVIGPDHLSKAEFYDEANYYYSSMVLELRDDGLKYRYPQHHGQDFVDLLQQENLNVGYKFMIPMAEGQLARELTFSRKDRIVVKAWVNLRVSAR